jgi:hypothetical protein
MAVSGMGGESSTPAPGCLGELAVVAAVALARLTLELAASLARGCSLRTSL